MNKLVTLSVIFSLLFVFSACKVNYASLNEADQRGVQIARCLADSGAQLYGSYTCGHCLKQKKAFGSAGESFLPYTECHPQGPNSEAQLCIEKKIEVFPTWILKDGVRLAGYQALETLQVKTGCTDEKLIDYSIE